MAAKKLTPQQQRDRRAKIMLGVLGAVLVLVMVIELPGLLGGKKPPSAASTTSTTTTTPAGSAAGTADASLAATHVVAVAQPGQLRSFSRFAKKDPFHPLVSTVSHSGGASGGAAKPGSTPAGAQPKSTTAPTVTFAQTSTAPTPAGPMVLGAVMKLNGVRRVIAVGSTFPAADPVFKLVAVGKKAIWISLIGGSFGDGQQTLKIMRNHPVKLVNTTASLNYLLKLVRMTMLPKPTAATTAVTPPPATTAAATTPSTAATTTTGTTG
jgi:hypothetical protein